MSDEIRTTAEAAEADVLPRMKEIHTDPARAEKAPVPDSLKQPLKNKSAAQWAYERLIVYIRNFEAQLDGEHEVAVGLTGGDAGVLRIEGMGYFDPDIVTFYGSDGRGSKTQLIQHVTQLNVMLRAIAKPQPEEPAHRIGFRLVRDIEEPETA